MNLNRMFVSIFIFLGLFSILVGTISGGFFEYQVGYVSPVTQSKEVADYFSANNITLYQNTWSFDIDLGTMEYNQSGLPDGHQVEFHWVDDYFGMPDYFELRHAYPSWFFGLWLEYHQLKLVQPYRSQAEPIYYIDEYGNEGITKDMLLRLADDGNSAYFACGCGHITQNFVVMPYNESWTLSESWDAGKLHVLSSYEIDFEAMKPSAWLLLVQVLTFQAPNLGIPGIGGVILSYMLGLAIWGCVVLLVYAAITSVIPTISGWRGGS